MSDFGGYGQIIGVFLGVMLVPFVLWCGYCLILVSYQSFQGYSMRFLMCTHAGKKSCSHGVPT